MTNLRILKVVGKPSSQYSTWVLFLLVVFYGTGCVPINSYRPVGSATSDRYSNDTSYYESGCGADCRYNHYYGEPTNRDGYYRNGRYYYNDDYYRERPQYRRLKKSTKSATQVKKYKKTPKYASPARDSTPAVNGGKPRVKNNTKKLNPAPRTGQLRRSQEGRRTGSRRSAVRSRKSANEWGFSGRSQEESRGESRGSVVKSHN